MSPNLLPDMHCRVTNYKKGTVYYHVDLLSVLREVGNREDENITLGEATRETNCYHAMSQILDGRFVVEGDWGKEKLREILFNQAAMSGVRVLTYAIMSNHFIPPLRGTLCS